MGLLVFGFCHQQVLDVVLLEQPSKHSRSVGPSKVYSNRPSPMAPRTCPVATTSTVVTAFSRSGRVLVLTSYYTACEGENRSPNTFGSPAARTPDPIGGDREGQSRRDRFGAAADATT